MNTYIHHSDVMESYLNDSHINTGTNSVEYALQMIFIKKHIERRADRQYPLSAILSENRHEIDKPNLS